MSEDQSNKQKVYFIGAQEIAGFLTRTSLALSKQNCKVVCFKQLHSHFHPEFVENPNIDWWYLDTVKLVSSWPKFLSQILIYFLKWVVLIRILFQVDACLFIGGKGLFNWPMDYFILKLFNRKVVHMYVGSASRPRFLSFNALNYLQKPGGLKNLVKKIKRQSQRVQRISKWAEVVIENPLAGQFQRKPFINYFSIGMPIDNDSLHRPSDSAPKINSQHSKIRILHCPSRPEIKGTKRIQKDLTKDFLADLNAELIIRSGISREEVLNEIEKSDLIIDQLYSDTPLAGFAAETVMMGKLPIVGGYELDKLRLSLPENTLPPSITCHPDNLKETLVSLLENRESWGEKLESIQEFMITGEWSNAMFGTKLVQIFEGSIPTSWYVRPDELNYCHGVGLSEDQVKSVVAKIISGYGVESLCISHIPKLEKEIIKYSL